MENEIEYIGFKDVGKENEHQLRRIVDTHVAKLKSHCSKFQKVTVAMKAVHESSDGHAHYELQAKLEEGGRVHVAEMTDYNLYFGLAKLLDKLKNSLPDK
ncbi:hypothetical protein HZB02_05660 [Candidatus Woesearchaeota archaeon]|nr:hypothetical protein [Candidatus Woesearchaeota archaeon]